MEPHLSRNTGSSKRHVKLLGVRLNAMRESEVVEYVMTALRARRGGWIITPNLDHVRRCRHDATFLAMLEEADLVVADGMPLVWAARLQGTPLPERVTGSSLVETLARAASCEGVRLFLLGGTPGAAENAARELRRRYPTLQIAGWYCPPFGFEHNAEQMAALHNALERTQPDLVYVALGSPKQERLIQKLRNHFPQTWWIGVGISLSFLSGEIRRAPRWMQQFGLEWLHRLYQEPRRLFVRYVIVGIPFAMRLLFGASIARFAAAR